ncbi:hypothetical protein SAMN05216503_0282 [Polaribacter sp. KT25b]|uniref:bacteriocin fulvocin C-related protein n=1 Tax=Polaribacter sp. KT25b TaxID=1855336 RepID=UPI00087B301B|nr:bacteriocin fulvocin C-related protein [Polaribacter sp. KT25b]SDR67429.1 hypothetical protein SAMN05216503_0282 [Polaribacter sp. KT25b]
MKNKTLEAKEKFGWSDKFIHDLFFATDNVVLKSKVPSIQNNSKRIIDQNPPDTCDCKFDWGCGVVSGNCLSNEGCKLNNGDCGFFGNDDCNGSCA